MKWGSQLETLEEIEESTGFTPKALASRPALLAEDLKYLEGFRVLNRARASGFQGHQSIAVAEVLAYLSIAQERDTDERLKFLRLVQKMDRSFLEHVTPPAEQTNE